MKIEELREARRLNSSISEFIPVSLSDSTDQDYRDPLPVNAFAQSTARSDIGSVGESAAPEFTTGFFIHHQGTPYLWDLKIFILKSQYL